MNTPEIEELKLLIEQKFGRVLSTTTDFDEFSYALSKETSNNVSTSTLKRMWGYVNDSHKPRKYTLDMLAQYIGHRNVDSFIQWLKTSTRYNSSFFNASQVSSSELQNGQMLEIGWHPNRLLRLRYLGESRYEVIDVQNSKLLVGDSFVTGCFIKGQPLLLPFIERSGERTSAFIAGRNGGLNMVNVLKE